MSFSKAGHPKNEPMDDQKITVNKQKTEMQATLKYHFSADSVSTQKVRPPKTNNKIGNAMFTLG